MRYILDGDDDDDVMMMMMLRMMMLQMMMISSLSSPNYPAGVVYAAMYTNLTPLSTVSCCCRL